MKYEAIWDKSFGAKGRSTVVAAFITFFVTSLLTFFVVESSDSRAPENSPAREGKTFKDIFCSVDVDAPMPYLRCGDPARRFGDLRRKIVEAAGFDFLATCGDMKRHEKATSLKPGVAYNSRHKSGLAFDYNQGDNRLLLVREDMAGLTYWRTYLRCEKQDGTCGVRADLDTDNAGRVSAFVFDFTTAAEGLGWMRIPAQEGWEYSQTKKEFWHYETSNNVAIVTTDSVAETKPDSDKTKQSSLITAALRLLAESAGWLMTEKIQPPRDLSDSISAIESRSTRSVVKESETVQRALPPLIKAGVTPSPTEMVDRQATRTYERQKSLAQAKSRPGGQTVMVMVRVEQGRVVQAYVPQGHPGMEGYEAAALRIARNRRYPPDRVGTEIIGININTRNRPPAPVKEVSP